MRRVCVDGLGSDVIGVCVPRLAVAMAGTTPGALSVVALAHIDGEREEEK
jgi:hypothetical protein